MSLHNSSFKFSGYYDDKSLLFTTIIKRHKQKSMCV